MTTAAPDAETVDRREAYSCLEAQIAGLLALHGVDHRRMFARAWGFGFRDTSWDSYSCLGERLHPGKSNPITALGLLGEMEFAERALGDAQEALDLLRAETKARRPVILSIDSLRCPWDPGYAKYSQPHFVVVTGVRGSDGDLLCNDYFYRKYDALLPAADWTRSLGTVLLACPGQGAPPGPDEVVRELHAHATGGMAGMPAHLTRFADALSNGFDLETEFTGYPVAWWNAPLFDNLLKASHGRVLAADALDSTGDASLHRFAMRLDLAGAGWKQARMMLLRAGRSAEPAPVLRRARDMVLRLRDEEEAVLQELNAGAHGHGHSPAAGEQPVHVPLACSSGARVFGCPHHPVAPGPAGGYLAAHDLPAEPVLTCGTWRFQLPELTLETGDHLACAGQSFALPAGRYRAAALLAAAHSPVGVPARVRLTVHYDQGPAQPVTLAVPSSAGLHTGAYVLRFHDGGGNLSRTGVLHPLSIPVDSTRTATALELPDTEGLKVFSITLQTAATRSSA